MYESEKKIIKICSKVLCDENELKIVNNLSQKNLDWGYLFYLTLHHRITAIVYDNFAKAKALKYIEKHIRRAMKTECIRIAQKNAVLLKEVKTINDCFMEQNLHFLNIKGATVAQRFYPSLAYREFTDIDYLVDKKEMSKVTECLQSLGYVQGEYNFDTNTIRPYSRKEIVEHSINSHESAEFVKLTDNQFFNSIIVDLNYNIIWNEFYKKGKEAVQSFNPLEKEFYDIDGIKGYHMTVEDELIQLCCHFYSEGVFFSFEPAWLRDKNDINIIKICDIYLILLNNLIKWEVMQQKVQAMNLMEPVCYALDCVKLFYDDFQFPFDIHKFFCCTTDEKGLVDMYYDKSYCKRMWNCTYEERIFDVQKKIYEVKQNVLGEIYG